MLQSLQYKDIDWQYKETHPLLEVKIKGSSKGGVAVHTKQVHYVHQYDQNVLIIYAGTLCLSVMLSCAHNLLHVFLFGFFPL